jgi:hypothetical protein
MKWTLRRLKESSDWVRSIGKKPGIHFRNGRKHAVVPPGSEVAKIHYDEYDAHKEPIKHLVNEAPLVTAGLGTLGAIGLSAISEN